MPVELIVTAANEVEPSRNWTLPVAAPPAIEVTIADNVTDPAMVALIAVRVVVVLAWLTRSVTLPVSGVVAPLGKKVTVSVCGPAPSTAPAAGLYVNVPSREELALSCAAVNGVP